MTEPSAGVPASGPLVLVASTDRACRAALGEVLVGQACQVTFVESVIDAITELHGVEYDLVFVALSFPPRTGADVVRVAHELCPETEVVVILDPGQQNAPLECVRHGAFDFVRQPLVAGEVVDVLERAAQRRQVRTSNAMFRASHAILTGTNSEQLPQMMVDLAADLLAADGVVLYQRSVQGVLCASHRRGFARGGDAADLGLLVDRFAEGTGSAVPLLLPDDAPKGADLHRLRSAILCPIFLGGQLSGVLAAARSRDPRPFRRADAERMGVLASQLRLAFDNARLFSKTVATERLAAIGELAAGVAHEINNPLTFVINNCASAMDLVEQLRERGVETDDLQPMLADAQEGAERILEIARDLRTLSRGSSATEVFDLGSAISSALRIAGPALRQVGTQIVTKVGKDLRVAGFPGRACQVFVNLLVNAAQAAHGLPKGTPFRVEVTAEQRGERTVVVVSDTGPGIAPEHLPRIFDAFFTTKTSESGTGLGLSITRTIIEDHRGTINVTSALGAGTTFTIDLPTHGTTRSQSAA